MIKGDRVQFYLCHKNDVVCPVIAYTMADTFSVPDNYIINEKLLPVRCQYNKVTINDWIRDRPIPKTRDNINLVLRDLHFKSVADAMIQNLGLQLNDCYWFKPVDQNITWEQVQLYRNPFCDRLQFIKSQMDNNLDIVGKTQFMPAQSAGELDKKWVIDPAGRRILIKGNYGTQFQQSLNEIFANMICYNQGWKDYTTYKLVNISDVNGCKALGCAQVNFTSEDLEFVSAWEIINQVKLKASDQYYNKFVEICVNHGLNKQYIIDFLDRQILLDYLLQNLDRHFNNFGILRDSNTLQWKRMAPIYDCGNSMFFRDMQVPKDIQNLQTHSFVKYESKLVQKVHNYNVLDLNKIPSENQFKVLYSKDEAAKFKDYAGIYNAYIQKAYKIEKLQKNSMR